MDNNSLHRANKVIINVYGRLVAFMEEEFFRGCIGWFDSIKFSDSAFSGREKEFV